MFPRSSSPGLRFVRARKLRIYGWVGLALVIYWVFWFLMFVNAINYDNTNPFEGKAHDANGMAIN